MVGVIVALGALCVIGIDDDWRPEKEVVARMFVESTIKLPLHTYRVHMGDFPSTTEGLQALITAPSSPPAAPSPLPAVFRDSADKAGRWRGPYVFANEHWKPFLDPWGNPYQYRYPGIRNKDGYDIWSKGPDGKDGTADDIGNWPKEGASTSGIPGISVKK